MRRRNFLIVVGALLIAAALTLFAISDPRNFVYLFNWSGHETAGERFGVKVGDATEVAKAKLGTLSGLYLTEDKAGGACANAKIDKSQRLTLYTDWSWRKGMVCLVSKDDQVVEIIWLYQLLAVFP